MVHKQTRKKNKKKRNQTKRNKAYLQRIPNLNTASSPEIEITKADTSKNANAAPIWNLNFSYNY